MDDTVRRKIIVYIATSADGFIARPNGAVDWLVVSRRRRNRRVHDSRGPDVVVRLHYLVRGGGRSVA